MTSGNDGSADLQVINYTFTCLIFIECTFSFFGGKVLVDFGFAHAKLHAAVIKSIRPEKMNNGMISVIHFLRISFMV